jgi:hypothetical protein
VTPNPRKALKKPNPYRSGRGPEILGPWDATVTMDLETWPKDVGEFNQHAGEVVGLKLGDGLKVDLRGVYQPKAIVIEGDATRIRRIDVGDETCPVYVHDAWITSGGVAQEAVGGAEAGGVDWSKKPAELTPTVSDEPYQRATAFISCHFEAEEFHRKVTVWGDKDIPGVVDGKVGPKWWVHAQCQRGWYFEGCTFTAAQEHSIYQPWALWVWVENCRFGAAGGTNMQFVQRYGKPSVKAPRFYGNPNYVPPSQGDLVVKNCTFRDEDIWSREASCITVVGWPQGRILLKNLNMHGSRGAIAIWTDAGKGAWCYDPANDSHDTVLIENANSAGGNLGGAISGVQDVHIQPDGEVEVVHVDEMSPASLADLRSVPMVVLDNIRVEWSENHSREQIMVTGANVIHARRIDVNSPKPKLVFGSRYGGPLPNGDKIRVASYLAGSVETWDPNAEKYVPLFPDTPEDF